ncbi:hypothetical protein BGZ74_004581 [Mortierella antarctica]|nr:hypothetical protein BGZ74_004581 [Mortierella antarctica]KAG0359778.1 hypothetical protein BG005_000144 [Podila minutissima]
MKLTTTLLAAAMTMATYVNADMIQINNPTVGTEWTAGVSNFVGWTGNCASMGPAATNVTVILNTGPSEAVRYVATLGTLDCSASSTRTDLTVPLSVPSGTYSIVVRTAPELSYTNMFTINNPTMPAAPEGGNSGGSGTGTGAAPPATTAPGGTESSPAPASGAAKQMYQAVLSIGLGAVAMAGMQML